MIKYEKLELPKDFSFLLFDAEHPPFYSMGEAYHWHDCFELSYAKSGDGNYDIGNRHYPFEKGELMVINNIEPHRMQAGSQGMNQIIMVFDPSLIWTGSGNLMDFNYIKAFVDRGEGFNNKISKDNPYYEELNHLIFNIEKEYQAKTTGWQLMIKAKLLELLTLLYRHFRSDTTEGENEKRQLLIRLRPVLNKIEEQFLSDLDAASMAAILHVTPQHFSVLFKEAVGMNFIDYIVARRMSHAKDMLITTSLGITEIAYASGFHNLSHFNRKFRQLVGTTPSDFRKSGSVSF